MSLDLSFALLCLAVWVFAAFDLYRGVSKVKSLSNINPLAPSKFPKVSLVFAARNEESTITPALESVLKMDYPDLEVIAVNDRSTDRTGEILEDFSRRDPRVQAVHIKSLPSGWLGKNHALQKGSERASGEWILQTDADTHFHPDAVRRAVSYAEGANLDFLAVFPLMTTTSEGLSIIISATLLLILMFMRPWRIPSSASNYIGCGPFNLLKASSYRSRGGHEPLRMRPDDDMMLGKNMQKMNGRCEFMFSGGFISNEWYENIPQLVSGLEKNTFASLEYSVFVTAIVITIHLFAFVLPIVGMVWCSGPTAIAYFCATLLMLSVSVRSSLANCKPWIHALFAPLGIIFMGVLMIRNVIVTHRRGGIVWRDTHYPLSELKKNIV